jgi:uncharacterized membrane protein
MVGSYACPGGQDKPFVSYDGSTLTPLPMPPGNLAGDAFKINDAGSIIGEYGTLTEGGGFLKTQDSFIPIVWPGMNQAAGDKTEASGLNSSNVVVGSWGNSVTGPFPMSFRWENGVLQDISSDLTLKGENRAIAVSNNGFITGWMGNTGFPYNYHAYIWDKGSVVDLGLPFADCFATEGFAVNDNGHAIGRWW